MHDEIDELDGGSRWGCLVECLDDDEMERGRAKCVCGVRNNSLSGSSSRDLVAINTIKHCK